MGVRGQIAGCPQTLDLRPQPREMRIRRQSDMNMRQRQPVMKALHDVMSGRATTLRFVVSRMKPSIVAQARPTPSTSERHPSHHRRAGS